MRRCKLIAFIAPVAVAAVPLIAVGTAVAGETPAEGLISRDRLFSLRSSSAISGEEKKLRAMTRSLMGC
jgi:hypothetical protein